MKQEYNVTYTRTKAAGRKQRPRGREGKGGEANSGDVIRPDTRERKLCRDARAGHEFNEYSLVDNST